MFSRETMTRFRLAIVLVAVAAFLFLMPSRFTAPARVLFNEAAGPVQAPLYDGAGRLLASSGTLTEMFLKEDRERALQAEVDRLRNENAALGDERSRLAQALTSLQKAAVMQLPVRLVRAPVASYDTAASRRSVTVRAGARDGVRPGVAAASQGTLVGVVTEAGPSQCRVRLITDPESAVPCRVSRTRELCVLQGTGQDTCVADWLDKGSFVEPGDLLVTASLDADGQGGLLLPDGVPAAGVTRAERARMKPLFLSVEAAPRVNLLRLEAVDLLVPAE